MECQQALRWNVAHYHSRQLWDETGKIPDHGDLKDEVKTHNKYKRLHSQSSQRVLEELAEAFNSCRGTVRGTLTVERTRPATARKITTTNRVAASTKNTLVQQSRGSRTASNTTRHQEQPPSPLEGPTPQPTPESVGIHPCRCRIRDTPRRHRRQPATSPCRLRQGKTTLGTPPRLHRRNRHRHSRRTRHRDSGD